MAWHACQAFKAPPLSCSQACHIPTPVCRFQRQLNWSARKLMMCWVVRMLGKTYRRLMVCFRLMSYSTVLPATSWNACCLKIGTFRIPWRRLAGRVNLPLGTTSLCFCREIHKMASFQFVRITWHYCICKGYWALTMSLKRLCSSASMTSLVVWHKLQCSVIMLNQEHARPLIFLSCAVACPQCRHSQAYFKEIQTRSADEPATLFFKCARCDFQWKEG